MHLSFLSPSNAYLSPVLLLFLLLLIKGGGSLNLSTLRANDLQEVSPPTKSSETERHRKRERIESVCLWVTLHTAYENV